jgi:hypothetical protein
MPPPFEMRKQYRVSGRSAPIHSVLRRGAYHLGDGLISPPELDFILTSQHSTGIPHSIPFTGTRNHCGPVLAHTAFDLCATSCPDRVLARDLQQITVPITARNFFFLLSISQVRSRMHCLDDMHLLEQGCNPCTLPCMLPIVGQFILAIRALSEYVLSHGTPANLSHEAANYSYSHY